jgi:hypothetical protein
MSGTNHDMSYVKGYPRGGYATWSFSRAFVNWFANNIEVVLWSIMAILFMAVPYAALFIEWPWIVSTFTVLWLIALAVWNCIRKIHRHREQTWGKRYQLAVRADRQHREWMNGDPRGFYGDFTIPDIDWNGFEKAEKVLADAAAEQNGKADLAREVHCRMSIVDDQIEAAEQKRIDDLASVGSILQEVVEDELDRQYIENDFLPRSHLEWIDTTKIAMAVLRSMCNPSDDWAVRLVGEDGVPIHETEVFE